MDAPASKNPQLRVLIVVVVLIAVACWLWPGGIQLPGKRCNWHNVTIKAFRAGVTPQQIEARMGAGKQKDNEWWWSPPIPPVKPGGTLPTITFEMLSLEKRDRRWYLQGSQFECHGQTFITRTHSADSLSQGTVQGHFGPGLFSGEGDSLALNHISPDPREPKLSFGINTVDEFSPGFTRAVWGTTISWPELPTDQPAQPSPRAIKGKS